MNPISKSLLVASGALGLFLVAPVEPSGAQGAAPGGDSAKVQGVTVSTHRGGGEWGTDEMAGTLDDLRAVGANWLAIHPYARIGADGSVRFRPIDRESPPAHLVRPIAEAHRRGLKILIKPHLAYWGSPFAWRGEITFGSDEQWQRFWDDYTTWITLLAEVCAEADAFAVGTELDKTLHFDREWRDLIGEVRRRTEAPLTYAANWTDYRNVRFWDALDAIGIQAYFPLTEVDDPSEEVLRGAWQARMQELREYAESFDKYVVFTELGYNRSWDAARMPWDYRVDGPEALELQQRLTRVALEMVDHEHRVVGAFLWKWFPRPRPVGRNFQLAEPEIQKVIREVWID